MATAVLTLLVPPIVARHLSRPEFSAWMLILQLAAYAAVFNLGIQSATSRYVAFYLTRNDRESASDIVSTAFLVLVLMAVVAASLIVVTSFSIGYLFPALPASLVGTSTTCLLLVGITVALGLPAEAIAGSFTGIQRSELVALIQGSGRLVLAAVLIGIAMMGGTMTSMAVAFAAINAAILLAYCWTSHRLGIVNISWTRAHWHSLRQIWTYSGTLIVWMVAMFFINGFDTAIVGRVEFASTGIYSACFGPILLIAGLQQALFAPLLQLGAARSAQGASASLPSLLFRATRLSTLLLLSLSVPLLVFGRELVPWWLGPAYVVQALPIFVLLLVGNTIRLLATPYALLLLATMKHRRVLLGPIVEAGTNVAVAVAAGLRFGAVGVACGVVAGAIVGQLIVVRVNAPRTMEIIGNLRVLLWKGVAQPLCCALPAVAFAIATTTQLASGERIAIGVAAILSFAAPAWIFCVEADERSFVRSGFVSLVKHLLPDNTGRRRLAWLMLTLLRQPHRITHRLSAANLRLYRQFARHKAHCCICGATGSLFFGMPDAEVCRHLGNGLLRETLGCKSCGSTNRQRTLAHTLISTLQRDFLYSGSEIARLQPGPRRVDLWDTDAFSPVSARIRAATNLTLSKYLPELAFGVEVEPGVFNIDLQKISFESARFDVILSSDVMEHVRNDAAAHAEIFRCLRPGGVYIFTVPYLEDREQTVRLVDTSTAEDVFLEPPHYHGDPITGKILSYRIYGRDFVQRLREVGFDAIFVRTERPEEGIFFGDCFIAAKPANAAADTRRP